MCTFCQGLKGGNNAPSISYAPGEPNIPSGSDTPNEYLSRALYLTLPVSKSPSIDVLIGVLTNIFMPFGTSVVKKKASVSVRSVSYTHLTLPTKRIV